MAMTRRTLLATTGALPSQSGARRGEDPHHAVARNGRGAGEEINKLIAAFNASQDRVEVTGLFKGVYKDLLTSVAQRGGPARRRISRRSSRWARRRC